MNNTMFKAFVALLISAIPFTATAANLTTIAKFDPSKGEFPENVVVDRANSLYVSLIAANEVRKITPTGVQSTYVTFDARDLAGAGNTLRCGGNR